MPLTRAGSLSTAGPLHRGFPQLAQLPVPSRAGRPTLSPTHRTRGAIRATPLVKHTATVLLSATPGLSPAWTDLAPQTLYVTRHGRAPPGTARCAACCARAQAHHARGGTAAAATGAPRGALTAAPVPATPSPSPAAAASAATSATPHQRTSRGSRRHRATAVAALLLPTAAPPPPQPRRLRPFAIPQALPAQLPASRSPRPPSAFTPPLWPSSSLLLRNPGQRRGYLGGNLVATARSLTYPQAAGNALPRHSLGVIMETTLRDHDLLPADRDSGGCSAGGPPAEGPGGEPGGSGLRDGVDDAGRAASGVGSETAAAAAAAEGAAWPPAEERLAAVVRRLQALPPEDHPPVSGRAAAVLVGLFEDRNGVVRVLLTQRSAQLKSHRGEVCLPGGKRDEEDPDDAATALREAHEELGLEPSRIRVLCRLPPVLSKHHLSVTPVVALLPPDLVPRPNPNEVAAAFTVPLAVFLGQFTDPRVVGGADGDVSAAAEGGRGATALDSSGSGGGSRSSSGRGTERRVRQRTAAAAAAAARPAALSWLAAAAGAGTGSNSSGEAVGSSGEAARGVAVGEDVAYEGVEHSSRDIRWGQHEYRIHSFQYGEYDVWGLTATICIDAARLALGREPSFQVRCAGGHHYSAFFWDGSALRVRPSASTAAERGPGSGAGRAAGAGEAAAGAAAAAEETALEGEAALEAATVAN